MRTIELPKTWNEQEVKTRLGNTQYKIERDYTETAEDGVTTTYYPAKLVVLEEKEVDETELRASYSKTQEAYLEEKRTESDPIEQRFKAIEARLNALEGAKVR